MTGPQGPTGMTGSQGQRGRPGSQGEGAAVAGWVSLRDIWFDFDETEIRPSERIKISDIAAYVHQNPSVLVGIDGSTDLRSDSSQYDEDRSEQRIANVRDALIQAGVSADRIETGSFGTERTRCDGATEDCSRRDGRVEVLARPSG
jgi:outer membrane protein OmpA-like peptidoglycan-associated protein